MKILVATHRGQGKRRNDFSWATDGEIVALTESHDGEAIDGSCGCGRSFAGIQTRKSTTTAEIVESVLSEDEFVRQFTEGQSAAWGDHLDEFRQDAMEMLRIASSFDIGAVVERRGDRLQNRLGIHSPQSVPS